MGGGMDTPCLRTELAKGEAAVLPFSKAGSPDNPKEGFDRAWYEDPVYACQRGRGRSSPTSTSRSATAAASPIN